MSLDPKDVFFIRSARRIVAPAGRSAIKQAKIMYSVTRKRSPGNLNIIRIGCSDSLLIIQRMAVVDSPDNLYKSMAQEDEVFNEKNVCLAAFT